MIAQHLTILGLSFVFMTTGLMNRRRGRGPWRAFLAGGGAMAVWELLHLLGLVQQ